MTSLYRHRAFASWPIAACLLGVLLCTGGPAVQRAAAQDAGTLKQIEEAMPERPRVEPAKPRTLLVFTLCKGYAHSSIPFAAAALEIMGRKTGAFTAVVTDDPAVFAPGNLDRFDAVCMDNTTGELFTDAASKENLLEFVRAGKGIVGIHAATDCFPEWPEYGEMMGGYFDGHPWGAGDTVTVKLDDPGHDLCRAFLGQGFSVKDEIYQIRAPYSRDTLRVLLSLDTTKTDMSKGGIKRTDGDFAVSWIRAYGHGRVFYNSLGHNHDIFWNPLILQYYLDGIQFALGDLPADTTPSAQLTPEYFDESLAALNAHVTDALFEDIAQFEFGDDARSVVRLSDLVVASQDSPEQRQDLADRFAALLDSDATYAAKQFACKQLYRIGTGRHVAALAPLLTDETMSDMARYALAQIDDSAVDEALLSALKKAPSALIAAGLANSLGERRVRGAVPALARLMDGDEAIVAEAAAAALGMIASQEAATALARARKGVEGPLPQALADASLTCADRLLAEGQPRKAEEVYEELSGESQLSRVQGAALLGLVAVRGDEAVSNVFDALVSGDPCLRAAAGQAARRIPGESATETFAMQLPQLEPQAQVVMLKALADRGDSVALPAVIAAVQHTDSRVRVAALEAVPRVGDASCVPLLAESAATAERDEADSARDALALLPGADVDTAIVGHLQDAAPGNRVELVRALAARNAVASVPALLESATDAEPAVRAEAFKALRVLATPAHLSALVDLLVAEQDASAVEQAEKTVAAVARGIDPGDKPAAAVLAALERATDMRARRSLLAVLAEVGDDSALPAVRERAASRNAEEKDAAIRALAAWPNPTAVDDLVRLAKDRDNDKTQRVLALRGLLRLLRVPDRRPVESTLALYKEALGLVSDAEEKKMALAGLVEVNDARALELVTPYLDDDDVKEEAGQAAEKLRALVNRPSASVNAGNAAKALDGDPATRWDTGGAQRPGQWFSLDMGYETLVAKVVLDSAGSANDYPRGYEVYVSNDPEAWGEPVAKGEGTQPVVEIAFRPASGRYLKIVQTGTVDHWYWSIHELRVQGK
ncbi:MAG: ThuA domain-containing protein [Candidatus Hydrogenedentes bacterium]|nr:ThuA domain-containing protein [Candidatus Hydrogenedentota bacterium]